MNEAVRVYVELARAGAGLRYLDVGGGLGIDYDGSQTDKVECQLHAAGIRQRHRVSHSERVR